MENAIKTAKVCTRHQVNDVVMDQHMYSHTDAPIVPAVTVRLQ